MGNKKAKQKAGTNATYSLVQLQAKHARLDEALLAERSLPKPDDQKISRLKKLKLLYKEQIDKRLAEQKPPLQLPEHEAEIILLPVRTVSCEDLSSDFVDMKIAARG
jgi:hypothetical protein